MNNAISLHHQLAFVASTPTSSSWGCCWSSAKTVRVLPTPSPQRLFARSEDQTHPIITTEELEAEEEGSSSSSSTASRFGKQDYWDSIYEKEATYSWYSGWEDLSPFLKELISPSDKILLPGVGNDEMLKDMYEDGYQQLTAFDYSPEGIERCKEMLGPQRIRQQQQDDDDADDDTTTSTGVTLFVGDARNLYNLDDESFDIVLEKGTLDAIIQSGGGISKEQKAIGLDNMEKSISEFVRLIKPGGKFISISAICTEALEQSPTLSGVVVGGDDVKENANNKDQNNNREEEEWELIRDGSMYITDDGFASNNFDGTLLAWTKKK